MSHSPSTCSQRCMHCTGMAQEGSRHGGQSWTEELIAQNAANSGGEEEAPKTPAEEVQYPAVERKLRSWYYHWVSALLTPCLLAAAAVKQLLKGSRYKVGAGKLCLY